MRYGYSARITLVYGKQEVGIIIRDDGPGIDDAQLENVFAPFVRLETTHNSDTDGGVRLKNRDGSGLRATLSLPVEAV